MSTTQQQAAQLLLQRRECRRSLASWARYCQFEPAKHHLFIIDQLERVVRGELKNLMILVPPGSAKSTYTSKLFVPWFLGQRPGNSILACSYSITLVERFGKWCRECISRNKAVLGYELSKHSQAACDWATSQDSVYFGAGVGSGIAGHRADLALIDDYLGTQEDADSKLIRDKQFDWYYNDFWPRLKPTAAQIIIANRRHEDDLVGRLLEKEKDKWTVIKLPMLAEENDPLGRSVGERLWPEWYTEEMVTTAKSVGRMWAGLYQQRPAPEEGDYFKRDWIVEYRPDDLPKDLRFYVGSDHAVSLRQENDRTCLLPAGVDTNGRLWILPDWYWCRQDSGTVVEAMIDMGARRKPIAWWLGNDMITKSFGPHLTKRMMERNQYLPIDPITEAKDKSTKAQSIRGRMSQKMVMFPSFAPDWDKALHELLTFPNGTHDDWVDALANIGTGLAKMTRAESPIKPTNFADYQWRPTMGWMKKTDARKKLSTRLANIDK